MRSFVHPKKKLEISFFLILFIVITVTGERQICRISWKKNFQLSGFESFSGEFHFWDEISAADFSVLLEFGHGF
jgi:hypothetical protein